MNAVSNELVTVVYPDGSKDAVHYRAAVSLVSRGLAEFEPKPDPKPKKAKKKASKKAAGPEAPEPAEKPQETPGEAGETQEEPEGPQEDLSGAAPEGQDADTAGYEPHDLI